MTKGQWRTKMKKAVGNLTEQKARLNSKKICETVTQLELFKKAEIVMVYVPIAKEVDCRAIAEKCWQMKKKVAVPKVDFNKKTMKAVEIKSLNDSEFKSGELVKKPISEKVVQIKDVDLVIVPGLGFDQEGNRLGRGGGYYDRFLADSGEAILCGVCFDCQVVEKMPINENDAAMDYIVTENKMLVELKKLGLGNAS